MMSRDGYYQWLLDRLSEINGKESYWLLMKTLQDKAFYSFIPNDDNRGTDGKALRLQYESETHDTVNDLAGQCTMLEFFIALAIRCYGVISEDNGYTPEKWFWELLKNVGLDQFTDDNYAEKGGQIAIDGILNKILDRKYTCSGKGGLFPLKKSSVDQKKVEIWYQMMSYLQERYYI